MSIMSKSKGMALPLSLRVWLTLLFTTKIPFPTSKDRISLFSDNRFFFPSLLAPLPQRGRGEPAYLQANFPQEVLG